MKLKKMIKENWLYSIIYTIGILGAIVAGWLLGRPSMLHATAFSGSSITYNENQMLTFSGTIDYFPSVDTMTINYSTGFSGTDSIYSVNIVRRINNSSAYYYNYITYGNCSLSSSTLTCNNRHTVGYNTSSSVSNSNGSFIFIINSNTVTFSNNTYTIVSTGYTEEQYQAYGTQQYNAGYSAGIAYVQAHPSEYGLYTQQQYNANYTAGQNAVINSPNTYNLYTQAQYESNYTSGYNAGVAYVQNHPGEYNLYTSAQYSAYGSSQYTAGQNAVLNSPNSYNLYTTAQYNAYGSSQYTAGETAVQNDPNSYGLYTQAQMNSNYQAGIDYVVAHPDEYNLYTAAQYNANAQAQYNAGYLAGQQASTNYQDGIQYVLDHPGEYNLYTTAQYNEYGTAQYTAGQNSVINDPNTYGLYNQVQMETAEQNSYSNGYQDGIDNYQASTNVIPTFSVDSMKYACQNGNNYHSSCNPSTSVSDLDLNLLKPSDYMPFTNVKFSYFNSSVDYGYNIDTYNYLIILDNLTTTNGTIAIPESVTNVQIKFCNNLNYYYVFGTPYYYCKSIATNSTETTNGTLWGVDDIYDNNGIYVGDITDISDGYRLLNLSNYLVGEINNYQWIQISLPLIENVSNIDIQYSNFSMQYINGSLDSEAYNLGFQNGYSSGNRIGQATSNKNEYNRGYNEGWKDAGHIDDNSVAGIAHTVLSTPVQMFKDIFDVEFLDINLAGFIMSIFTIIVVIWLIKKFW